MPVPDKTSITRSRAPDLVPGYKLEALVGKGGMGEVHKATQLSLGRTVAVKLLSSELAKDPAFVARFEKEAAALATLSHPHIVSIVDKGRAGSTYFLVMEYVDGPSLREVMRSPLLDSAGALKIGLEICRAIDYAHSRGVFHRDLKPENILFDEQAGGIPKVSDFGLAGFLEGAQESKFNVTETHVAMGTAAYMAPEQRVDAKTADHRADIYSLGVILYELVVGELPMGNFDPPSHRKPGVDKRLDQIIARCLKPIPADRYQTVSDLIADLEPLVPVTVSMAPRKVGRVERASMAVRRAARNATRAAAALVVLAALGVLAISALRSHSKPSEQKPGEQIISVQDAKAFRTVMGQWDETPERRTLTLGEGVDELTMVPFGRNILFDKKAGLNFPVADKLSSVGRAGPDFVGFEGIAVTFEADVKTQEVEGGLFASLRRVLTGEAPNPSSTLMLIGDPGRYVSLTVFGNGSDPVLQWALGERDIRGYEGEPHSSGGNNHLKLQIDKRGAVLAYVGTEPNVRAVGHSLALGSNWKHLFGSVPKPAVGCIEGTCSFQHFRYSVERERPFEPPPPPPPPVVVKPTPKPPPPHPTPQKKTTTVARRTEIHSEAHSSSSSSSKKTASTTKKTSSR